MWVITIVILLVVISRVTIHIRGLITLLIITHEPPSAQPKLRFWYQMLGPGPVL